MQAHAAAQQAQLEEAMQAAKAAQRERDELQATLSEAQRKADSLAADLEIAAKERDQLRTELSEAQKKAAALAAEVTDRSLECRQLQASLTDAQQRADGLAAQLLAKEKELQASQDAPVLHGQLAEDRDQLTAEVHHQLASLCCHTRNAAQSTARDTELPGERPGFELVSLCVWFLEGCSARSRRLKALRGACMPP